MKILTAILTFSLLALLAAIAYREYRPETAVTEEQAPIMIYAGEDLEAAARATEVKPSLYSCSIPEETLYLVIAASGEFMMFDATGAWINAGRFFEAKTDKGVEYYHAELGKILLGMFKTPAGWRLAIVTPTDQDEFVCK